jgi:hypothetical protein
MCNNILFSVCSEGTGRLAHVDYAPAPVGVTENADRFFNEVIFLSCKELSIDANDQDFTIKEHKEFDYEERQVLTTVEKLYPRVLKVINGESTMGEMFPNSVR